MSEKGSDITAGITATYAKNHFGEVIHRVLRKKEGFIVTQHGRNVAVILSPDVYFKDVNDGK